MPISLSDAELQIVMDAAAPFSERSLYMAKAVARLRPDLAQQVRKGEMSINKAYVLATGKTKPTS